MTNLEEAVVEAAKKSTNRKPMAEKYGSWFSETATSAELVSWCDSRIAKYQQWIENCKVLKSQHQLNLVQGMTEEDLEAALAALRAVN